MFGRKNRNAIGKWVAKQATGKGLGRDVQKALKLVNDAKSIANNPNQLLSQRNLSKAAKFAAKRGAKKAIGIVGKNKIKRIAKAKNHLAKGINVVNAGINAQLRALESNKGGIIEPITADKLRYSNSESWYDVTATGGQINSKSWYINPMNASVFQLLSEIANSFGVVEWEYLSITYKIGASMNQQGQNLFAIYYDVNSFKNAPFASTQDYINAPQKAMDAIYQPWSLVADLKQFSGTVSSSQKKYSCYAGDPSGIEDLTPYYSCIFVTANTATATGTLGTFFVNYRVCLSNPKVPSPRCDCWLYDSVGTSINAETDYYTAAALFSNLSTVTNSTLFSTTFVDVNNDNAPTPISLFQFVSRFVGILIIQCTGSGFSGAQDEINFPFQFQNYGTIVPIQFTWQHGAANSDTFAQGLWWCVIPVGTLLQPTPIEGKYTTLTDVQIYFSPFSVNITNPEQNNVTAKHRKLNMATSLKIERMVDQLVEQKLKERLKLLLEEMKEGSGDDDDDEEIMDVLDSGRNGLEVNSHRATTGTDDLLLIFFLLILNVIGQLQPFTTTTVSPTNHFTRLPTTKRPTSLAPTRLPTTHLPSKAPTPRPTMMINHYSLIQGEGSSTANLWVSNHADKSSSPILTYQNGLTMRYNGVHGYDVNMIICLHVTPIVAGACTIGNSWAPVWNGSTSVETGLQVSCWYGHVPFAGRDISVTLGTVASMSIPVSLLYAAVITELPNSAYQEALFTDFGSIELEF